MQNDLFATVKEHFDLTAYCESLGWQIDKSAIPYRCLSPFRTELHPSFCIYPETQSWSDFGDKSGGDIIALVSKLENISQGQACLLLAKKAGISVSNLSQEDLDKQNQLKAERSLCESMLTRAAEYYHSTMTKSWPNIQSEYFEQSKGLNNETIDKFKLGFSDGNLYNYLSLFYSDKDLLLTGLFIPTSNGLIDYFVGRAVYPYWSKGSVVYMIAREIPGTTPKTKYEYHSNGDPIKFKKLPTRNDKRSYISETIRNDWLYGLDSLGSKDTIIITEGVADCLSAIQIGYACLSPVTTQFRKRDIDQLVQYCKQANRVIICNDNEDNKSGYEGAKKTGIALAKAGLDAYIANIPRSAWESKVDLNDYIRINGASGAQDVFEAAIPIINFLLDEISDDEKDLNKALEPVYEICSYLDRVKQDKVIRGIQGRFKLGKDVIKGSIRDFKLRNQEPEVRDMSLKIDNNGDPIDSDGNLAIIFRNHPDIAGTLGYNLRNTREYILKSNPLSTNEDYPQPFSNAHVSNAIVWLQNRLGITTRRTSAIRYAITEACSNTDVNKVFDPIADWLEELEPWDGVPRINRLFIDRMGADDIQLYEQYARCFCISLIARAMEPGCKVDTVPILISKQGQLKSTMFRHLVPDDRYFLDNTISIAGREGQMLIHGPWIVELQELASTRSMDVNSLKASISNRSDDYRRPWGTSVEKHPRTCVFVGTANDDQILKDLTGNRRFWPMRTTKKLDVDSLIEDRDQIMAEALLAYRRGEQWWLEDQYEVLRGVDESNYMEDNVDLDVLEEYLNRPYSEILGLKMIYPNIDFSRMFDGENRIFISQIELTKISDLKTRSGAQRARLLRVLGWERMQITDQKTGKRIRLYYDTNLLQKDEVATVYRISGNKVEEKTYFNGLGVIEA